LGEWKEEGGGVEFVEEQSNGSEWNLRGRA